MLSCCLATTPRLEPTAEPVNVVSMRRQWSINLSIVGFHILVAFWRMLRPAVLALYFP
jgi:hypothetical protein